MKNDESPRLTMALTGGALVKSDTTDPAGLDVERLARALTVWFSPIRDQLEDKYVVRFDATAAAIQIAAEYARER